MQAKIKIRTIIDANFTAAYQRLMRQPMPMAAAFKLKSLAARLTDEQKRYEELRMDLLNKYGDKDDKGVLVTNKDGYVQLSEDKSKMFRSKHKELLDVEIEFEPVKVGQLGSIKVSGEDLMVLDSVIQE